jgi:DNA repair protein RadD
VLNYWYQEEAINAMLSCKDNGVVVLPTASGKSHVLRGFAEKYPGRVLILSHVKEILVQDFECLAGLDDIGMYSAGVGVTHIGRVTVAGIQSVWRKPYLFKDVDILLIDEAHLVSNEGMYKTFITAMKKPYLGLTATDFRLKGGYIHGPGGMFDSVCYSAPVGRLTSEGYLCPLEYVGDKKRLDTTGIK